MKRIIPLLAWRYIRGTQEEKNISIMVKICFGGIMIGSCALALILSIMSGIEQMTHEKLQGIHAQIIIRAYGDELNASHITRVLRTEFPQIAAISPTTIKQAIIQSPATDDITNVIVAKAIDPDTEQTITSLEEKIVAYTGKYKTLSALLRNNQILIGYSLAQELKVKPGDTVSLLYTTDNTSYGNTITFAHHDAVIGGIFATGMDEFDSTLMICSLDFLNRLWPDTGITQININLAPGHNEQAIIAALRKRLTIEVFSWKELYPGLVSALKLEKYAMFFILLLITLVACTNVISFAFMHIQQKRGEIAILKSMGMSERAIKSVFTLVSIGIASLGSLCGLLLAAFIGTFLSHYPLITLPDAYYISHLPISMKWHFFAIVFMVVILLSILATWIPIQKIRTITIAHILRSEA